MAEIPTTPLPSIPGYSIFAGPPASIEEYADLVAESESSTGGVTFTSQNLLEVDLADPLVPHLPNHIHVRHTDSGTLVGASRFRNKEPYVMPHLSGWVHPDFRGDGIATAMIDWGLTKARETQHLATEGSRVTLECEIDERNKDAIEMLVNQGFSPSRHFLEMEIALGSPAIPVSLVDGATLHPFDREDDFEPLADAMHEAFKDHFGFVERPREDRLDTWRRWMESDEGRTDIVWLVKVDDEIVGANISSVTFGSRNDAGYVNMLGVVSPWRGKGIAKALLITSFDHFAEMGHDAVVLHVDADSLTGATRLYEGVGMHSTQTYTSYEIEIRPGIDQVSR